MPDKYDNQDDALYPPDQTKQIYTPYDIEFDNNKLINDQYNNSPTFMEILTRNDPQIFFDSLERNYNILQQIPHDQPMFSNYSDHHMSNILHQDNNNMDTMSDPLYNYYNNNDPSEKLFDNFHRENEILMQSQSDQEQSRKVEQSQSNLTKFRYYFFLIKTSFNKNFHHFYKRI